MQPEQPPSPWAPPGHPQHLPPPPDPPGQPGPAAWPTSVGYPPVYGPPVYGPPTHRGPNPLLLVGLVVAVVAAIVVGAAAVNAYARHSICTAMEDDASLGGTSARTSSGQYTQAELDDMHGEADDLRGRARMLLFDRDLRSAVNGLADDVDNIANLLGSTGSAENAALGSGFAELLMVAASVNGHARQAQRACGLPANGLLNN
ncbi:hypothetical protein BJ973_003551 [Actinoplanes tereljensis]|uniref:Uncharacterized protein n=1 Tax=Paractinoplanes tereljensis TaxID=571912 RepID=A0A919NZ53_9ACTN|nr:hypothetical protein [Actinoplanes tereljensis]GIF26910.1 hypothetical protein Ate02nite_96400 [Actinoplanes tereljensis]